MKKVDVVFWHDRSYGDDDGLAEFCTAYLLMGFADCIAINGADGEGMSGVRFQASPGKDLFLQQLDRYGVPRDKIFLTRPARHTREENDAFLDLAIEHGWKSAVVVAHPHQTPRAMLGLIRSMEIRHHRIRAYTDSPGVLKTDWLKIVRGSQGKFNMRRGLHALTEAAAILKFWANHSLTGPVGLCRYLLMRPKLP